MWKEVSITKMVEVLQASSFREWFARIMDTKEKEAVETAAVVAWLLWKSRNERIFEGKRGERLSPAIMLLHIFGI